MKGYFTKSDLKLKALILAGGRGKRLENHTNEENKCMLKFRGKPLIEYSLDNARSLNITEIIVVVGHLAEHIINTYGNSYKGMPVKYVIQKEQHGLVHAIECARPIISDFDFILLLGDEFLLKPDHVSLINSFKTEDVFTICGVIKVKDRSIISKTYSILYNQESKKIFRLVKKPKNPSNDLMGTGNVIFRNQILEYIEKTPINQQRGERELPDLIQCAIDNNKKVLYQILASSYVNVNTPEDLTIIKNIISE